MQELGAACTRDVPSLAPLAQAVREASLADVSIADNDLSRGRDVAEMEQVVTQTRADGRDLLERPARATSSAPAASGGDERAVASSSACFGWSPARSAAPARRSSSGRSGCAAIPRSSGRSTRSTWVAGSNRLEGRARLNLLRPQENSAVKKNKSRQEKS